MQTRGNLGTTGNGPQSVDAFRAKLCAIRDAIDKACLACGRAPSSVKLVGVSKTVSAEGVKPAIEAGLEDLGENYLKEAREKAAKLPGVRWHLIGRLQSNKVNLAVDLVEMIHSLDSADLIRRVDKRCGERGCSLPGLIQVRLGEEATKSGVDPDDLFTLLDDLASDPPRYLRLVGLMTIPPPGKDPEDSRPYFRQLRKLLDQVTERKYPFWGGQELSMGMSEDYLVAVEEGATLVRVGRALFGARGQRTS